MTDPTHPLNCLYWAARSQHNSQLYECCKDSVLFGPVYLICPYHCRFYPRCLSNIPVPFDNLRFFSPDQSCCRFVLNLLKNWIFLNLLAMSVLMVVLEWVVE